MASLPDYSGDELISGWQLSVTMQSRTPLRWLQRHGEFHLGNERPIEHIPMQFGCWMPVLKTWRELGIDEDEIPASTIASEVGQIPEDGGDFLTFLMEYRMIVEDGGGTLTDLANRFPHYRHVLFPPPKPTNARKQTAPVLSISILDFAQMPDRPDMYHFNFEFHCSECGGYVLDTPDNENEAVRCKACGVPFDTLAKINDACRAIALDEMKARKLGAFRET